MENDQQHLLINKLLEVRKEIEDRNKQLEALHTRERRIIDIMATKFNLDENIDIPNNNSSYLKVVNETKPNGLSFKYLEQCFSELRFSEEQKSKLLSHIKTHRPLKTYTTVKEYVKRTPKVKS
jgi:hypothetical protein